MGEKKEDMQLRVETIFEPVFFTNGIYLAKFKEFDLKFHFLNEEISSNDEKLVRLSLFIVSELRSSGCLIGTLRGLIIKTYLVDIKIAKLRKNTCTNFSRDISMWVLFHGKV